MAHGDGRLFQPKKKDGTLKSARWWIAYYVNGREVRESAGKTEKEAQRVLRRKLAKRDSGQIVETEDTRLTVAAMLDTYEADLRAQRKKSAPTIHSHLKPVRAMFGDRKALSLVPGDFEAYRSMREKKDGREQETRKVERATIDHELGALRAAYGLARKQERISRVPFVPMYGKAADVVRQGFVERADFDRIASLLRDSGRAALADAATFAYLSAWRRGEVIPLKWAQVDRAAREVKLQTSKSGHPRTLPLEGELSDVVERRWQARSFRTPEGWLGSSPYVFHDGGTPIGDFRKAWAAACKAAGVPGRRFHDLRRSGVRNLVRSGVSQSVAMSISGHRTVSTFIRYDIASDEDKREALRAVAEHASKSRQA
jgi:integrase